MADNQSNTTNKTAGKRRLLFFFEVIMNRQSTQISISIWIQTETSNGGDADESKQAKLEGCFKPKPKQESTQATNAKVEDKDETDEDQALLLRLNYPA